MISFELNSNKTGIDVFLDKDGVDELISYLNFIKKNDDHFHLLIGNELKETPMVETNTIIKQVNLMYY